jgi:uncharacterized protein YycO
MHPILLNNNIQPADRIVIPKSEFQLVQHHAVYLGQNYSGQDLIAENKYGIGVRLITAEDFFSGVNKVTRIERFSGSNGERKNAVQRALDKLGQPYHLINFNCESFANHVQHAYSTSKQVAWGFLGLLAFIFVATSTSKRK